jgi:hypothetical protein
MRYESGALPFSFIVYLMGAVARVQSMLGVMTIGVTIDSRA